MAIYFTNIGPAQGPYLARDATAAIGVLQARDNHMPIGMAMGAGIHGTGAKLWRLTVHGVEVPGLFVVIDREFRPVQ